ncbi:MAG: hypothetical protein KDB23_32545, partial [Planctomycetales bacterium]|nr:hypothetical protein [Planctomycetales bacterium]
MSLTLNALKKLQRNGAFPIAPQAPTGQRAVVPVADVSAPVVVQDESPSAPSALAVSPIESNDFADLTAASTELTASQIETVEPDHSREATAIPTSCTQPLAEDVVVQADPEPAPLTTTSASTTLDEAPQELAAALAPAQDFAAPVCAVQESNVSEHSEVVAGVDDDEPAHEIDNGDD